jgi:hypothetical protein
LKASSYPGHGGIVTIINVKSPSSHRYWNFVPKGISMLIPGMSSKYGSPKN